MPCGVWQFLATGEARRFTLGGRGQAVIKSPPCAEQRSLAAPHKEGCGEVIASWGSRRDRGDTSPDPSLPGAWSVPRAGGGFIAARPKGGVALSPSRTGSPDDAMGSQDDAGRS